MLFENETSNLEESANQEESVSTEQTENVKEAINETPEAGETPPGEEGNEKDVSDSSNPEEVHEESDASAAPEENPDVPAPTPQSPEEITPDPSADEKDSEPHEPLETPDQLVTEPAEAPSPEPVEAKMEEAATPALMEGQSEAQEATPQEEPKGDAVPAEATEKEEEVAPVPTIELTEKQNELIGAIEEILEEDESIRLLDATPEDLITLISFFSQGNVGAHVKKVGLVKRSFDAIRAKDAADEAQTEAFREALAGFNKLRAENKKQVESQKADNAQKKRNLLVQLKEIIDSEDVYRIKEVRDIQDAWKIIGHVPKKDLDEMYREYRSLLDNFYQRREMHFELLEYDRKINLQEKEKLIEEAKKLIPEEEERENVEIWKQKMDMFHELQQQWRSIGHVPREDMERVRDEFRSIVDQFFEARQEYVDLIDKHREDNAEKKEALLTKMQAFAGLEASKPREWNNATKDFRTLQEAWKAIGPAPKSVNNELWQKYRKVADEFFTAKSNFFKQLDEQRAENLAKKVALCEQVEGLTQDSNWEKTARTLKRLQKEWKEIGPVPERQSNKVWNRFKAACDAFFENRRTHYQSLHKEENENLEKKRKLIDEVRLLIEEEDTDIDIAIERVKELQAEWRKIGKVPYKEKDKIWEEFRGEVDDFFNSLSGKRQRMRNVKFKSTLSTIKDDDKRTRHIRAKMSSIRKRVHKAQEKVDQYSNNMLFIAKGKSGDKLRKQIQDELDKEIEQIDAWKKEIRELQHLIDNPPEEPVPETDSAADEHPKAEAGVPLDQEAAGNAAESAEVEEKPAQEEEGGAETAAEEGMPKAEEPDVDASAEAAVKEEEAPTEKTPNEEKTSPEDAENPQEEGEADPASEKEEDNKEE